MPNAANLSDNKSLHHDPIVEMEHPSGISMREYWGVRVVDLAYSLRMTS